jgi:hypothetical protein
MIVPELIWALNADGKDSLIHLEEYAMLKGWD